MKKPLNLIIYFFILLLVLFIACQKSTTEIEDIRISAGVKGIVMDSSGQVLKGVKIFCLYNQHNVPPEIYPTQALKKQKISAAFDFKLEQNLPNPFSNSTFIRFALPDTAHVDFQILNKLNDKLVFQFSEDLEPGYYQRYLEKLVETYQLTNGPYRYILKALIKNDTTYSDTLELFVISDKGKPNAITNDNGKYSFEFNHAFIGDSLIYNFLYGYKNKAIIHDTINFLFIKEGYLPKLVSITLYPDIILNYDVVMLKGEE